MDYRNYNEILLEAFENANEKSSKNRTKALTTMCTQLKRHYVPKFLGKHLATIVKLIQCVFERNIGTEVKWTAQLVAICYMQLPREIKFLERFRPMVLATLDNQTFSVAVKSDLCKTIAILIFLHKNRPKIWLNTMLKFEEIFNERTFVSYENVITPKSAVIVDIEFLVAILEAWTFLYTLLDSDTKSVGDR